MAPGLKQQLLERCNAYVQSRLDAAQHAISELQASANEETKSSAGDKYETGRAMVQLEIEKHQGQRAELLKQQQTLINIAPIKESTTAQPGAIVETNRGSFFLSISAGQMEVDGQKIICISINSPIGSLLRGLKAGDTFTFNKMEYTLAKVN